MNLPSAAKHVKVLLIEAGSDCSRLLADHASHEEAEFKLRLKWAHNLFETQTFLRSMKFDAVILDMTLHDFNEVLPALRIYATETPMIVLGNQTTEAVKEKLCRDFNIYDCIDKSDVSKAFLLHTLKHAIAFKGLEADVAQAKSQLRQAQKLESIGQLTAGIAHDFNNKLAIVLGNISTAYVMLTESQPQAAELLQKAQEAVESATSLTRRLLEFCCNQENPAMYIELNAAVDKGVKTMRDLVGENIKLDFQASPVAVHSLANPTQLDQVLMNLIINARDAIQGRGRISVSVLPLSSVSAKVIKGKVLGPEFVCVRVQDTGSGMSRATLKHIFEPFYTTKREKGTGLGLSVVRGIVTEMGGFIDVQSKLGKGTIFDVYLRVAQEAVVTHVA